MASRPLTACPWIPALAPRRHHPAPEGQQAHRRLPPGPLLQGLALPRRPAAEAPGDRAAGAADPGGPIGATAWGSQAGGADSGGQVCGPSGCWRLLGGVGVLSSPGGRTGVRPLRDPGGCWGVLGSSPHQGGRQVCGPSGMLSCFGGSGSSPHQGHRPAGRWVPGHSAGLGLVPGSLGRLCDRQACMCVDPGMHGRRKEVG